MEDIYEKILWEGYGLKFRHGTRTRTGLICRTDMGLRELKKPRGNMENLRFAFDVKKQLRKNGFTNISRFYTALDGEPFYLRDGVLYSLEDPMPVEPVAEENAETFIRGAEMLGKMHAAAKGLSSDAARWEKNRLPGLYAKRKGELMKIRRRSGKKSNYDAVDLLLLQYYEPFLEQTKEAEALLQAGGYGEAVEQAAETGAFCHNTYKGDSLRLTEQGQVFIGGFDRCGCELPLMDLASYLRRYLKKTDGNRNGVEKMLEAYEKSCPLQQKDRTILMGMLLYPEKFLRLVNEYYNRRRTCVSPAMQERLSAAASEEKHGVILKEIIGGN